MRLHVERCGHCKIVEVNSGRKIPCCKGESKMCQRRAGLTLYQVSYIPPTPFLVLLLFTFIQYRFCLFYGWMHLHTAYLGTNVDLTFHIIAYLDFDTDVKL